MFRLIGASELLERMSEALDHLRVRREGLILTRRGEAVAAPVPLDALLRQSAPAEEPRAGKRRIAFGDGLETAAAGVPEMKDADIGAPPHAEAGTFVPEDPGALMDRIEATRAEAGLAPYGETG